MKKISLRLISVAVSVSMMASLFAGINIFSANAESSEIKPANKLAVYSDDFETDNMSDWVYSNYFRNDTFSKNGQISAERYSVDNSSNTYARFTHITPVNDDIYGSMYSYSKDTSPDDWAAKVITGKLRVNEGQTKRVVTDKIPRFYIGKTADGTLVTPAIGITDGSLYTFPDCTLSGTSGNVTVTSGTGNSSVSYQVLDSAGWNHSWTDFKITIIKNDSKTYTATLTLYAECDGSKAEYILANELTEVSQFSIFTNTAANDTNLTSSQNQTPHFDDVKITYLDSEPTVFDDAVGEYWQESFDYLSADEANADWAYKDIFGTSVSGTPSLVTGKDENGNSYIKTEIGSVKEENAETIAYVYSADKEPQESYKQKLIQGSFRMDKYTSCKDLSAVRFLLGYDKYGNAVIASFGKSETGNRVSYLESSVMDSSGNIMPSSSYTAPNLTYGTSADDELSCYFDYAITVIPQSDGSYTASVSLTNKSDNTTATVKLAEIKTLSSFGIMLRDGDNGSGNKGVIHTSLSIVYSSAAPDAYTSPYIVQPDDDTEYEGTLFTGDDFEDADLTAEYWNMQGYATAQPAFSVVDDGTGNGVLKAHRITSTSSPYDSLYKNTYYTVKNKYWPDDAVIQQINGKISLPKANLDSYVDKKITIYYIYDPENGIYKYINLWHSVNPISGNADIKNKIKASNSEGWFNPTEGSVWYSLDPTDVITFKLKYALNTDGKYEVTLTLTDEDGNTGTAALGTFETTGRPCIGGDASYSDNVSEIQGYYDNIQVKAYRYNSDSEIELQEEFDEFYDKYRYVLRLNKDTISSLDADIIAEAKAFYESLSSAMQARYNSYYETLLGVEALLADAPIDDPTSLPSYSGYPTVTEDFESGNLRKWVNAFPKQTDATLEYDEELNSNVLRLNNGASGLMIKPWYLSEKASVTGYSLKFKLDPEKPEGFFNNIRFFYNYIDEDNWSAIDFYANDVTNIELNEVKGDLFYKTLICTNGTFTGTYKEKTDIVFNGWVDLSVSITGDTALFTFVDPAGKKLVTTSKISDRSGKFTLFAVGGYSGWDKYDILYDDITVNYEQGDWDVDVINKDIVVYYEGNTYLNPGDTVTLQGDNAGKNIRGIEIMRLEDDTSAGKGYIAEETYETNEESAVSVYTSPVEKVWDSEKAVKADILQKTEYSVKFTIPEDFKDGVYAVKLTGREGYASQILYLNNPEIDYTVGDEGDIATAGGYIRVIGNNIAPNQETTKNGEKQISELKAVLVHENGAETQVTVDSVQSDYSIKLAVPDTVSNGTYELWIYNGYGDSTSWGKPATVVIGNSPKDSWSKQIFNVKDFGATGDKDQNATPHIVNALTAASENTDENGNKIGGIVYLPKGVYTLRHSISIPANVTLLGEDMQLTNIVWQPDQWRQGELLPYVISVKDNVEIKNISFYGTRIGSFIQTYGSKNFYMENCRTDFNPYSGPATETSVGCPGTGIYSHTELWNMAHLETQKYKFVNINENTKNVQLKNVELSKEGKQNTLWSEHVYYLQLDTVHLENNWSQVWMDYSIWENCTTDENCLGFWGNGVYSQNNTLQNVEGNNRELFVADLGPDITGTKIVQTDDPSGTEYKFLNTKSHSTDKLKGYQLYVSEGQGNGQVRHIVSNEGYTFKIDKPFTVATNRNSTIVVRKSRNNDFFVGNTYYNGACGGYYSGFSNVIYDSNHFDRVGNIYNWAYDYDVNWYLTIQRNIYTDPYHRHVTGMDDHSGFTRVTVQTHTSFYQPAARVLVYRDNDFGEFRLELGATSVNSIMDCIIENNSFENVKKAVVMTHSNNSTADHDGIYIKGNTYLDVDTPYTGLNFTLKNKLSSLRVIAVEVYESSKTLLGDVNFDGKVTLKDCTLIKYHIVGKLALNSKQQAVADVNGDGKISLLDATEISYYILGKIKNFTAENSASGGDSSSNTSSGTTSSDEYYDEII